MPQLNPPRKARRWKSDLWNHSPLRKVWIFYLPDAYFIISPPRWKSQITDIPRWFSELHPDEFWYYTGGINQSALVSARVSSGLEHFLVTFFPKYSSNLLIKQNILYSVTANSESRRQEPYISNQVTLTSNLKAIQWQILSFDKSLKASWYWWLTEVDWQYVLFN